MIRTQRRTVFNRRSLFNMYRCLWCSVVCHQKKRVDIARRRQPSYDVAKLHLTAPRRLTYFLNQNRIKYGKGSRKQIGAKKFTPCFACSCNLSPFFFRKLQSTPRYMIHNLHFPRTKGKISFVNSPRNQEFPQVQGNFSFHFQFFASISKTVILVKKIIFPTESLRGPACL